MFTGPFPPEVWAVVLPSLRKPIPAPLSKPPRDALRQPDLAVAMRTCRLFKEICTPLLYTRVVTDDFSVFLKYMDEPSYRANLAHTRQLYIEYSEKGREPTYRAVLRSDRIVWSRLGLHGIDRDVSAITECKVETEHLHASVLRLRQSTIAKVLPRLISIAVASLYGPVKGTYDVYDQFDHANGNSEMLVHCRMIFANILTNSNLEHLCVRISQGPFNHVPAVWNDEDSLSYETRYQRTVHFDNSAHILTMSYGAPIRWVSDIGPKEDWGKVLLTVGHCLAGQVRTREILADEAGHAHDRPTDVELFCSTDRFSNRSLLESRHAISYGLLAAADELIGVQAIGACLTKEEQQIVTSGLKEWVDGLNRRNGRQSDSFMWRPSFETPTCQACGSGVPE